MNRLADVMRHAPGLPDAISDADFVVGCSCGTEQRLNVMSVEQCGPLTLYDCAVCQNTLVGVVQDDPRNDLLAPAPMTRRQESGGHRLHGFVIGSKCDVALQPLGAERPLALIPATPYFFVQYLNM
ncbi:MAG: hypothetical protein QOE11_1819 [Solirubrobacteraceae bacterium]|jgi:hypothetical protein|nr:hypothetical protein [Solirubrobacteraceae bacterium]